MEKIYVNNLSETTDKYEVVRPLFDWNTLEVEFIYKSDFVITKDLRDFVEVTWEILWLPKDVIARMILISDELNNNAIEYGSDQDWYNILRIKVKKEKEEVDFIMEVEDNGKWRASKTALDMETMRAHKLKVWYSKHDSIRWRWLFLTAVQVADRLYFKNSPSWGLIVWIKKKLKLHRDWVCCVK